MGDGLKQQWGVNDPKKAGSDKQATEFKAAFQSHISCVNGHLQYTSANAEVDKHAALAAKRDALYPAFQGALAQIDPKDPSKAKAAIDKVLADAKGLSTESAALRKAAEKALADWKARQPKFDAAVHQVEELETWGDAKAAPLRALVDGIRTQTNERRYAPASATVDQLLPKLKPIYDEYLKQKAAKPKYEQMLAEQSARLDVLKAAEEPSQPMKTKTGEADTALQAAKAKADAKDYVGGTDLMKPVKTAIDELDKLAKDPDRAKYLADRKAADEVINTPIDPKFKTLEADWNAILQLREQALPLADAGDYKGANKSIADLKTKVEEFQKKHEELKKDKEAYDQAAAQIETHMQEVNTVAFPELESKKAELVAEYQKLQALAEAEDFKGATKSAAALETTIAAFLAERDKLREQIKSNINSNLPTIENDMKGLASAKSPMKDKINTTIASVKAAAGGNDDAALAKAAKDLEQLPKMVSDLKQIEEVKGKIDAAKTPEEKKKAAQDAVADLEAKGGLANLPVEARNVLVEEMMKGTVSAKDTAAINKVWATPSIDPAFDALDKPVRDKIIKQFAEDPKILEYRKNWATMTGPQRQEAMKYITSIPCGKDGWNVGDPKEFEFFDSPAASNGDILYGSYNSSNGKMRLNTNNDAHGNFDEMLDTISHEIGHKQQAVLVKQYKDGTLKPGDANYEQAKAFVLHEKYKAEQPDGFKQIYSTSPKESHSRQMGSEVKGAMKEKFPPAPAVPPSPGSGTGPAPTVAPGASPKIGKHDHGDHDDHDD